MEMIYWIIIGLIIGISAIVMIVVFLYVIYPRLEKNAQPLTDEELILCEKIIKDGKGYPFVCKRAIRNKKCPCLPCEKLNKAKQNLS